MYSVKVWGDNPEAEEGNTGVT